MMAWLTAHDWLPNGLLLLLLVLASTGLTYWGRRPPATRDLGQMSGEWLRDRGIWRRDHPH